MVKYKHKINPWTQNPFVLYGFPPRVGYISDGFCVSKSMKKKLRSRRRLHQKGYILVEAKYHPYADGTGYVPEHRLVMEKHLGFFVDPTTHDVHHVDEDVQNNKLSNLQYLTKIEHRRTHAGWEQIKGLWWKTCNTCEVFQEVNGNFYKRKTTHNEYVSECKPCIKEKTRLSTYKRKKRVIYCKHCNKKHIVTAKRTVFCSIQCSWNYRRNVKLTKEKGGVQL